MQKRHLDRKQYFLELAKTSREYYIDYVKSVTSISPQSRVLEIGCGEGGNLMPFAELGCHVYGIDINEKQIDNAKQFFNENNLRGDFLYSDFMNAPAPEKEEDRYDLILLHDVIEHIEPEYKPTFIGHMQKFMKRNALVFVGFPAWQMPFGGHQQIGVSKISKIPYVHLFKEKKYKSILEKAGEKESTINELLSIKRSKMPIELFEKTVLDANMKIVKRTFWVINPHYKAKFHLLPLRAIWPFSRIPHLRNFYITSAWYLLSFPDRK